MTLCDATSQHFSNKNVTYLGRTHRIISVSRGTYIHAIAPTAPAVHHSPHLVTAKQLKSELGHAQSPRKVRSPDSDSDPVILARAGQKKFDKLHFEIGYTSKGYHVVVSCKLCH